ncbi:MAG: hypothetical protein ACMXYK_00835 [Candidatus Woesearchaeota archaeon]
MQLTIDRFSELSDIKKEFQKATQSIKEELDEHLYSINQNSEEIQTNYDYLEELHKKIDKITARLDTIEMHMTSQQQQTHTVSHNKPQLSDKEKEAFLVLYTSNEPLSYEEIAARSGIPTYHVEEIINTMEMKRIPIVRRHFAGKLLLVLDEKFKEMQSQVSMVQL